MKLKLLRFIIFSIALSFISSKNTAQTTNNQGGLKAKWTTNPFDPQVFIENNGQFDGKIESGEKILYGVQMGSIGIFFTPDKVIYRYDKNTYKQTDGEDNDPDNSKKIIHEVHYLGTEWVGANKSVNIVAKEEKPDYYAYGKGLSGTIKANLFKEIIYKNLYPGVDVVYRFIEDKEGIKYALIIHPGADLSKIKINYTGAKSITKNAQGDLLINSELDEFTEHAPVSNYLGERGNIKISNVINGNTESFKANENYDKSKTVVIDPWVTNPLITPGLWNKAYDLDWDYNGNVYAYGGLANSGVLQLVKLDSVGVILWTYNAGSISDFAYGDFCTDKYTGTSYLIEGGFSGAVIKVSTNAALLGTYGGSQNMNELWRTEFDVCNRDVVIGGGGTGGIDQAGVLDTNMSSINMVNVMGVHGNTHDVALLTIDPDGTQCYMASIQSRSDAVDANNVVMKLPLPSLSPTAYEVHEQLGFLEEESVTYAGYFYIGNTILTWTNGMNGAAASSNSLYLYNGDTLRRYNKNTGAYISGAPIRDTTPYQYGGLDVDGCDNLFVGVTDSIYVMDPSYSILAKFPLPGTVFDVHLGEKGALYACGVGFVARLVNPIPAVKLISSVTAFSSSCACNGKPNGKATVNVNCGFGPFKFSWSNGSTNQTDTGLCQGTYTVIVTDGACPPTQWDTGVVTIRGDSLYAASIKAIPDTICQGDSALLIGAGGGTYLWSNKKTNDSIYVRFDSTSSITMYINMAGCKDSASKIIFVKKKGSTSLTVSKDTICQHDTATLIASGGTNYIWSNNSTASSITVSPDSTRTYTVISSVACAFDTLKRTIYVNPLPKPTISGRLQLCRGSGDTLTVSGGTSYLWSNGSTSNTYILDSITKDYTISVKVYNGKCPVDTTFHVDLKSNPEVSVSNGLVCLGQCDTLTAITNGKGNTFSWNNGATSSNIIVCPDKDTTYTVSVSNGCVTTKTTKVLVTFPQLTACCDKTIGPGDADTIQAGMARYYSWSPNIGLNCTSCPTVIASPTVTTIYTVTGTDSDGCILEREITVTVEINCKGFDVPNVFTPNNDGIDDYFTIKTENLDKYSITIYDRWGKEMYKSSDPNQPWDGNTEEGAKVPDGVYYYFITADCQNNTYNKDGYVQVIR